MKFVKTIIKKILRFLGWKLISLKIKKHSTFVNQKPELDEINCISEPDGILHFGAHRGKEATVYNWFNKKVFTKKGFSNTKEPTLEHCDILFKRNNK